MICGIYFAVLAAMMLSSQMMWVMCKLINCVLLLSVADHGSKNTWRLWWQCLQWSLLLPYSNLAFYTTRFHLAIYIMYSYQLSELFLNSCFILEIWTHGLVWVMVVLGLAGVLWVLVLCISVFCWSNIQKHYQSI